MAPDIRQDNQRLRRFYRRHARFHQAVDCVIFGFESGELKLLLIRRKIEPARGRWSLMGGFLRPGESLEEAARRVLEELTGLYNVYLEQLHTFSRVDRDPGERVISTAFFTLIGIQDSDIRRTRSHGAEWIGVDRLPPLVFDHASMASMALETVRRNCRHSPVGFELLPPRFTMPQLQKLYEAIYGRALDSANFRRKMLANGLLVRLGEKDYSTSRRGAYYYRFNQAAYARKQQEGFCRIFPDPAITPTSEKIIMQKE